MLQEFVKEGDGMVMPKGKFGEGISLCFQCEDAVALYREFRSRSIAAEEPICRQQHVGHRPPRSRWLQARRRGPDPCT